MQAERRVDHLQWVVERAAEGRERSGKHREEGQVKHKVVEMETNAHLGGDTWRHLGGQEALHRRLVGQRHQLLDRTGQRGQVRRGQHWMEGIPNQAGGK